MSVKVRFVFSIVLVSMMPVLMASSCQMEDTMGRIRQVHMGAREAFITADDEIAPMLEAADARCIEQADALGLTEQAGMNSWRMCMSTWQQISVAVATTRRAVAELENIYDTIEAGSERSEDWLAWGRNVVSHANTIIQMLEELDVDVPDGLQTGVDMLCNIVGCAGE